RISVYPLGTMFVFNRIPTIVFIKNIDGVAFVQVTNRFMFRSRSCSYVKSTCGDFSVFNIFFRNPSLFFLGLWCCLHLYVDGFFVCLFDWCFLMFENVLFMLPDSFSIVRASIPGVITVFFGYVYMGCLYRTLRPF